MMRTEQQRAARLADQIARVVGTDQAGHGECILPTLHDAFAAVSALCRDRRGADGVDATLFGALMDMAHGETGRLLLLERLKPEHRAILNAAIHDAAAKIVAEEGRARHAA